MPTPNAAFLTSILTRTGLLTEQQVGQALEAAPSMEGGLVAAVVSVTGCREADFLERLAPLLGMEFTALAGREPERDTIERLPPRAVF